MAPGRLGSFNQQREHRRRTPPTDRLDPAQLRCAAGALPAAPASTAPGHPAAGRRAQRPARGADGRRQDRGGARADAAPDPRGRRAGGRRAGPALRRADTRARQRRVPAAAGAAAASRAPSRPQDRRPRELTEGVPAAADHDSRVTRLDADAYPAPAPAAARAGARRAARARRDAPRRPVGRARDAPSPCARESLGRTRLRAAGRDAQRDDRSSGGTRRALRGRVRPGQGSRRA